MGPLGYFQLQTEMFSFRGDPTRMSRGKTLARLGIMASVLRRSAALVLIVLGLLPFTAPFPTCDLVSDAADHSGRTHTQTTSLADPSALRIVSLGLSIGRPRLAALSGVHQASADGERPAGTARRPARERWIGRHSASLAILRI
jgi:hypothetical protein